MKGEGFGQGVAGEGAAGSAGGLGNALAVFFGEWPQGEAEALAGEIGAAGLLRHEEAPKLDNEFEAIGTSHDILADPGIAVFEMLGGPGPTEDGDKGVAAGFQVLLVNALPENMSGRTAGFEVVFAVKDRSQLADFQWLGGGANVKGSIHLKPWGEVDRGSHDSPTMQIHGDPLSQ